MSPRVELTQMGDTVSGTEIIGDLQPFGEEIE
jgi:hypothetical protein